MILKQIQEIPEAEFLAGKEPSDEMIESVEKEGTPLFCTSLLMYESCGRFYTHALPGCAAAEGT